MSADWKAGDRALCVALFRGVEYRPCGEAPSRFPSPSVGVVYLVSAVELDFENIACLHLAGMDDGGHALTYGYVGYKFRKLVPACDRNEREQTELMPHEGFWEDRP